MLVLKKITKRFGNRVILNKINASYPSSGMFGIYGESGSGKSTLLNIISLLDNDYSGTLKINNLDPKKDKINVSRTIGIIYQHFNLLNNLTSYENVELASSLIGVNNRKNIENALKSVNLDKKLWHKKVINLSGGEKERVAIARALINNPEILLMDEPFGALDALTRENIQNLIRKIWWNTGKTILFITHDVEEALLLASRIIVVSKHPGRVIEDIYVNFSKKIIEDNNVDIKFTEEFYKYREKLLKLINNK